MCPACGLRYDKWLKHRYRTASAPAPAPETSPWPTARAWFAEVALTPRDDGRLQWVGRVLVWALLMGLGWASATTSYEDVVRGSLSGTVAFLHRIDLVFHEAGHVLFAVLGNFMAVLGGSLLQLLVPLIVCGVFLFRRGDPFGASVGLWWAGQSFADLAPYIADARALRLPLLGGGTGADRLGVHDWENILERVGWLDYDRILGGIAASTGIILMAMALFWGAMLLVKQHRHLSR